MGGRRGLLQRSFLQGIVLVRLGYLDVVRWLLRWVLVDLIIRVMVVRLGETLTTGLLMQWNALVDIRAGLLVQRGGLHVYTCHRM